jgi:hypothetical protein
MEVLAALLIEKVRSLLAELFSPEQPLIQTPQLVESAQRLLAKAVKL